VDVHPNPPTPSAGFKTPPYQKLTLAALRSPAAFGRNVRSYLQTACNPRLRSRPPIPMIPRQRAFQKKGSASPATLLSIGSSTLQILLYARSLYSSLSSPAVDVLSPDQTFLTRSGPLRLMKSSPSSDSRRIPKRGLARSVLRARLSQAVSPPRPPSLCASPEDPLRLPPSFPCPSRQWLRSTSPV